jgi:hypothetical protein
VDAERGEVVEVDAYGRDHGLRDVSKSTGA